MSYLLQICVRCPDAACNGACRCRLTGLAVAEQVTTRRCPRSRFRIRGLGDLVARLLELMQLSPIASRAVAEIREINRWLLPDGAEWQPGCGCAAKQAAMNEAVPFGRQIDRASNAV